MDVNPRIVEPLNGLLAGVDLVEELLQISLGREVEEGRPVRKGMEGVETHQLLLAMLKAAEDGRAMLLVEMFKAVMGFDQYAGSVEELTPLDRDMLWTLTSLIVMFWVLLIGGSWVPRKLRGDSVANYSLTYQGWTEILGKVGRVKEGV